MAGITRKVSARMLGDRWITQIDSLCTSIHTNSEWWSRLIAEDLNSDIDLTLEPEEWELFDKINAVLGDQR
jgi:hypothetical protein